MCAREERRGEERSSSTKTRRGRDFPHPLDGGILPNLVVLPSTACGVVSHCRRTNHVLFFFFYSWLTAPSWARKLEHPLSGPVSWFSVVQELGGRKPEACSSGCSSFRADGCSAYAVSSLCQQGVPLTPRPLLSSPLLPAAFPLLLRLSGVSRIEMRCWPSCRNAPCQPRVPCPPTSSMVSESAARGAVACLPHPRTVASWSWSSFPAHTKKGFLPSILHL